MPSLWPDISVVLLLAYFNAGMNLILFHTGLGPVDQPGYVSRGFRSIVAAGIFWPVVARLNRELAWFLVIFFAAIVLFSAGWFALGVITDSVLWRGIPLLVISVTGLFGRPAGFVGSIVWNLIAKPFGLSVPSGLERMLLRNSIRNLAP